MDWENQALITFGCSFTYGHGLPDCKGGPDGHAGPTHSEQAWPAILGKLKNMKVDNKSRPGASNNQIAKTVVDYINNVPSLFMDKIVVVILWSNNDRETIYTRRGEAKLHMSPGFLTDKKLTFPWIKNKKKYFQTIRTYYESYYDEYNVYLNQVIRMNYIHAFLNDKGIKNFQLEFYGNKHLMNDEDKKYFPKLNLKKLKHIQFDYEKNFHIDDALDYPNPHPGVESHKLLANNIRDWFFNDTI